jgi:chromosome segregation ATPase
MVEQDVEKILADIRNQVIGAMAVDATPPATNGSSYAPVAVASELIAVRHEYPSLTVLARSWDRLPPLVSNRSGAAARFELWLKAKIKRLLKWITWEQVNFNAATHHTFLEIVETLSIVEQNSSILRNQLALEAQTTRELLDQQRHLLEQQTEKLNDQKIELAVEIRSRREQLDSQQTTLVQQQATLIQQQALLKEQQEQLTTQRSLFSDKQAEVNEQVEALQKLLGQFADHFEQSDAKFTQLDKRFQQLDPRLAKFDLKFQQADDQIQQFDSRVQKFASQVEQIDSQIKNEESQFQEEQRVVAETRFKQLVEEFRERDERLLDELRVTFKQLSLELTESQVLQDRARRELETRIQKLE